MTSTDSEILESLDFDFAVPCSGVHITSNNKEVILVNRSKCPEPPVLMADKSCCGQTVFYCSTCFSAYIKNLTESDLLRSGTKHTGGRKACFELIPAPYLLNPRAIEA